MSARQLLYDQQRHHDRHHQRLERNPAKPAIPGSGFTVTGASPNRDAALLGVGVRYKTSSGLAVYADYEAMAGRWEIDHPVIAGLKFTW